MMNLSTAGIPATLVLLLGAAACGGSDPEQAQEAVQLPGATVVVRDTVLPYLLPAAGLAEPILRATLSTRLMARVTEVTVHKKMGAERYTWFEEGGIWQKKPVKAGN